MTSATRPRKTESRMFQVFLCLKCIAMYEDKLSDTSCAHCGSDHYIRRYIRADVVSPPLANYEQARRYWIEGMIRDRDRLSMALNKLIQPEKL